MYIIHRTYCVCVQPAPSTAHVYKPPLSTAHMYYPLVPTEHVYCLHVPSEHASSLPVLSTHMYNKSVSTAHVFCLPVTNCTNWKTAEYKVGENRFATFCLKSRATQLFNFNFWCQCEKYNFFIPVQNLKSCAQ